MGEMISRDLQRQLLAQLSEVYPQKAKFYVHNNNAEERANGVNLSYLIERGLVAGSSSFDHLGAEARVYSVCITADGLDFLADDGGLGAILGVVTIKIHDDTIRKLIIQHIERDADASDEDKSHAKHAIAKMSDKALSTVVEELTKKGLENMHKVVPWVIAAAPAALRAAGVG